MFIKLREYPADTMSQPADMEDVEAWIREAHDQLYHP